MMNPIDMQGPEFLKFYFFYGFGLLLAFRILRTFWVHTRLPSTSTRWSPGTYPREGDGYLIAFLRGGKPEVATALLSRLVTTGRLVLDGRTLRPGTTSQMEGPRLSSLEQTALAAIPDGTASDSASSRLQTALEPSFRPIEEDLERNGLLVTREQRRSLRQLTVLAMLAVPGLGLVKLGVAVSRGHFNIGYLILLILVYSYCALLAMAPPRQTPAGRKYLAWLQASHQGLVDRVTAGRRSGEDLALLVGIYGLAALPTIPYMQDLRQAMQPPGSSSTSGDSGSGCGSDSGGDGGGGGCGGCGGGGD
jgi:uncharacterized protein (TIGR04222 family)